MRLVLPAQDSRRFKLSRSSSRLACSVANRVTGASKPEGKCARLHSMWQEAGDGKLLPRAFAIELAIAEGVNASTARAKYQVWFKRAQSVELPKPPTIARSSPAP